MRRTLLVPFVAVLVATGACGRTPSKSSFIAKADDICRVHNAPVAALKTPTSFPELSDAARSVASATDAQVPRLRRLSRPSGAKGATDAVFNSLAGVSTAAKSLQAAAVKSDEKASAQAANDLSTRASQASDGAKGYGFASCGSATKTAVDATTQGANKVLKASFVLKAEQICKETSSKLDALPDSPNLRQEARTIASGVTILTKLVSDLKALTPPPGDEATLAEFLDAQQKVVDKTAELQRAAQAGDERLFASLVDQFDVLQTAANAKADAYGITSCGTDAAF